jgi:hypothetical protein
MSSCRSCGAEIEFVKQGNGKFHPVEAGEAEVYYLFVDKPKPHAEAALKVVVLADGTVIRGWEGRETDDGVLQVEGRESHFAFCPQAPAWRK